MRNNAVLSQIFVVDKVLSVCAGSVTQGREKDEDNLTIVVVLYYAAHSSEDRKVEIIRNIKL